MYFYKFFLTLSFAMLSIGHVAQCSSNSWTKPLYMILRARTRLLTEMINVKDDFQDQTTLNNFLQVLQALPKVIETFELISMNVPETSGEGFLRFLPEALRDVKISKVPHLFRSKNLAEGYQENIDKMTNDLENRIEDYLSDEPNIGYTLPLDSICPSKSSAYAMKKALSITDICSSIERCSSTSYPYGGSVIDTDVTQACTKDKKCDLEKALPMMVGVFWFAMNQFILQRLCLSQCITAAGEECKHFETLDRLTHEARLLKAYTSALPQYFNNFWKDNFFQKAVDARAFSDLDVAMSMIQERKSDFAITPMMCDAIQFTKACPYADIYKEYIFIKKVQQSRTNPGLVKDLRLQSQVDHAKMAKLQKDTLNHIELLGTISKLDDNLQASVSGISSYFKSLANYDEGIADADEQFIRGELDKYEKNTADIEKKLKKDFTTAMGLMQAIAVTNAVEQAGLLAARVAENCNPLRVIFGGSEPGDIVEQGQKVADASSTAVKATTLFVSLQTLAEDSLKISEAFHGASETSNKNQITSLKKVVDKIRKNEAANIGQDADHFVREYGGYTPQRDRSLVAHNNALWSAYKEAMCDILNGEVGFLAAVPKSVAGGMLICESLEGTLTQFFTLREEIFDFQFQLVDAVTSVIRGNIAKKLAQNIKGKGDVLVASDLMIGFLMTQNRLQTHSSLYCDKLEYRQLGKPVAACSTTNGLFTKDNIDSLIAYTDHSRYDRFERDVYIPTKPRFEGDTGCIDLTSLGKGESVIFKLPVDDTWLQDYRWTLDGETTVPFVEKFEIFFPNKDYKTGEDQEHTTTRVTITSIAGSSVSTVAPNTSPVYILPRGHSTYVTVYEEGYSSCPSAKEIDNPYSLCQNLPKICDKSSRQAGESLLPTILSTWNLRFKIVKGSKTLKWDAPSPSTNLLIRAKVTLRMLPSKKKRSHLPHPLKKKSSDVMSRNGCCDEGNRYRNSLSDRKCKTCPDRSTSKLRGLYCEINEGQ